MISCTTPYLAWRVLLTLALAIPACAKGPVEWPKHVKCGSVQNDSDIASEVFRILHSDGEAEALSRGARDELARLAAGHGAAQVACRIEGFIQIWSAQSGPSAKETESAGVRGRRFLMEVGTEAEPY